MDYDKPNSDVRRRRYDTAARYAGMQGHTARQRVRNDDDLSSTVTRDAAVTAGNEEFKYLDVNKPYGEPGSNTLKEPYKITAFELDGFGENLNRENAWEAIPHFLQEHSVGVPAVRRLHDGRIETTFQVEAAGLILPDPKLAAANAKLNTHIYEIRRHKPRLVTVVPTEPPESVTKPLLKAALHCVGGRVPQTAVVRCNDVRSAWLVERSRGKPLEIDLGSACKIMHFSTQGRHMPTRRYPFVWKDHNSGQLEVEDAAYHSNVDAHFVRETGRYTGPYWMVRTGMRDDSRRLGNHGCAYHSPQWVSQYELLWRAENGRKWHSLGVFKGNTDETSEVVHTFTNVQGGVVARYLRVVPLESTNGGAMRVGVYGEPLVSGDGGAARRTGTRARADGESELATTLVEYRITQPTERANRHLLRDSRSYYRARCRCSYCMGSDGKTGGRGRRKVDAQHAASAYTHELDLAQHDAMCEMMCEMVEDAEAEAAHCAEPRASRELLHAVERLGERGAESEQVQLALALSSSITSYAEENEALAIAVSLSLAEADEAKMKGEVVQKEDVSMDGDERMQDEEGRDTADMAEHESIAMVSDVGGEDDEWEMVLSDSGCAE